MIKQIKKTIHHLWWFLTIIGCLSIVFGIIAIFYTNPTLNGLVNLISIFIIILALAGLFDSFYGLEYDSSSWLLVILDLLFLSVGIYFFKNPNISLDFFISLIGWILIIKGIGDLTTGLIFSFFPREKFWWSISGIINLFVAFIIWKYPLNSAIAAVWVLGFYFLINGIIILNKAISAKVVFYECQKTINPPRKSSKKKK